MQVQKITPFLWFDNNAEEAMNFYVSVFKNSQVLDINHSGKAGPGDEGTVMTVYFELDGVRFVGLNGGPMFSFSEAISFWVYCDTQEEIDDLWGKLTVGGGEPGKCGWLKDKFGLSWQLVPSILLELLNDKDPVKRDKVLKAVWQMEKLDMRKLQKAAANR
jgi:predicted 3-demethylubiquinone-9 3-methyltransferase (glyoxalase superfamily)